MRSHRCRNPHRSDWGTGQVQETKVDQAVAKIELVGPGHAGAHLLALFLALPRIP